MCNWMLATVVGLTAATDVKASLVADGFVSGTGGGYNSISAATTLLGQNAAVPGFTGAWTQGTGSTAYHVDIAKFGLTYAGQTYPSGGSVGMTGATADAAQSVGRTVTVPSATTYYMSGLYERGGNNTITSGAYSLMGFGNSTIPTADSTASAVRGVYVGFVQTADTTSGGTADNYGSLIIRTTQLIGGNDQTVDTVLVDGQAFSTSFVEYLVVTKLALNTSGASDTLTYWVNPTNLTSESQMNSTSLLFGSVTVDTAASSSDFSQLTFAEKAYNSAFSFDEPRIATTLSDLTAPSPTPEPSTLAIALGGVLLLPRRRAC